MAVTSFKTPLIKKEKAAGDAWKFFFKKPSNFNYQAGQYIKMYLDISDPDDRGVTRYFTLSSSPTEDYLLVTTRILKSSFKLKLGNIKIGTKVKMRGPWGDFILDDNNSRPLVFLSGGIGLTPFRSMLRYVADKKLKLPITFFTSYKSPAEILYKEEFEKIARYNPSIKIITTITKSEGFSWKGEVGRINEELLKKHLDSLKNIVSPSQRRKNFNSKESRFLPSIQPQLEIGGFHEGANNIYYIAGPDQMVDSLEKLLIGLKIPKKQIKTDGFPGY